LAHVVVCGAGLTGLTTAWHLLRAGHQVTVVESESQVGGVLQTTHRDGFLAEHGANSATVTPALLAMIDAVELRSELRLAAPHAKNRFIVRNGVPHAVPMSPPTLLTSRLFTPVAKLRLLGELFVPARPAGAPDESVADFARRRLGSEMLTYAIDPFVSGVYAGDPETLSTQHAFPTLVRMERDHGSLIRGAIAAARARKLALDSGAADASVTGIVSFTTGMHALPRAIATHIGIDRIHCNTHVRAIAQEDTGLRVSLSDASGAARELHADRVISTLPLHALATVALPAKASRARDSLTTLNYPAVASLALGFRRSDVAHALDGFGCLIPSIEGRSIMGILFSSTLFEGRAPRDTVLLTCFLGGVRRPHLGTATTDELLRVALPELAQILGVRGPPIFEHHVSWPHAIPQYGMGHERCGQQADALERAVPGLTVDGQFRRGVSVGDCVASGALIAARATA
jgi:protoporphyrinogen/coproporphyrinogen III oxidase